MEVVPAEDFVARAVEVLRRDRTSSGDRWSVGSGYLVTADLVLTAGHNLGSARPGDESHESSLLVRCFDERDYVATSVALGRHPGDDIGLVRITDERYQPGNLAAVRFATLDRSATTSLTGCWAVGFPRFKEVPDPSHRGPPRRDSEQVHGVIAPGSNVRRGLYELLVTATPSTSAVREPGESPWSGISGAVVFVADSPSSSRAIGVVIEHHLSEGSSSLTVIPVDRLNMQSLDGAERVAALLAVADFAALPQLHGELVPLRRRPHAPPHDVPSRPVKLKRPLADFSGRQKEIDRIVAILRRGNDRGSALVVIHGMGGVGKTTIANHLGHLLAPNFGYARILLDLGGPNGASVPTSVLLEQIFDAFEVPVENVPQSRSERASLLQSLYRSGPTLLILDDAVHVDQVEPLLPREAGPTAVIVTSRSSLPNLDGARRVNLLPVSAVDALAMLAGFVEDATALGDEDAARRIIELVGGLPLAVRLIAGLIDGPTMQGQTLDALAQRLEDTERLLAYLDNEDRGIRATLDVSYQTLAADAASCFRKLGLVPGGTFTIDLVAAAIEVDLQAARAHLITLIETRLLEPVSREAHRYRMHDLVRLFALGKATEMDSSLVRAGVLERIVRWYAAASRISLEPPSAAHRPSSDALAWFDTEDLNAMAVVTMGERIEDWKAVGALVEGLRPLLWYRRRWEELLVTETAALLAAAGRGYWRAELDAIIHLAEALRKAGSPQATAALYERAVQIARSAGDPVLEGWVLTHHGDLYCDLDRPKAALACYRTAQKLFESVGDMDRLAWLSAHTMGAYCQLGKPQEAVRIALSILDLAVEPAMAIWVHWHLALARADLRQYDEAEGLLLISVEYHRTAGDKAAVAHMLTLLGEVRAEAGHTAQAVEALDEALDLAREAQVTRMIKQVTEDLAELREGRPISRRPARASDL